MYKSEVEIINVHLYLIKIEISYLKLIFYSFTHD
jgi:hypothetical protein